MFNAVLTKLFVIALGYYSGVWVDKKLETSPYGMMGGLILGLCLGFAWLLFVARRVRL